MRKRWQGIGRTKERVESGGLLQEPMAERIELVNHLPILVGRSRTGGGKDIGEPGFAEALHDPGRNRPQPAARSAKTDEPRHAAIDSCPFQPTGEISRAIRAHKPEVKLHPATDFAWLPRLDDAACRLERRSTLFDRAANR